MSEGHPKDFSSTGTFNFSPAGTLNFNSAGTFNFSSTGTLNFSFAGTFLHLNAISYAFSSTTILILLQFLVPLEF